MKRPLILISNDDGVMAKGINELVRMVRPLGDIVVMAPDSPRSGASCSITSATPVSYSAVRQEEGLEIYQCTGTPTDCVKLAADEVLTRNPDLILGGINHGDNSAVSVHYSGTIGVVKEGCIRGVPSVGFSLCNHAADADFAPLAPYVRRITEQVLTRGLPTGVCLNVNFPDIPIYKGVRVCRQTKGCWTDEWEKRRRPRGGDYFWLTGEFKNLDEAEDCDRWALDNGYVAIAPIQIDETAYRMLEEMRDWNLTL